MELGINALYFKLLIYKFFIINLFYQQMMNRKIEEPSSDFLCLNNFEPCEKSSRSRSSSSRGKGRSHSKGRACNNSNIHDDYEIIKLIDKGSLGKVYKAKSKATGEVVAIKKVKNAL